MDNLLSKIEYVEYDEDSNRICPVCSCHYKNIEHKCPEWLLLLINKQND